MPTNSRLIVAPFLLALATGVLFAQADRGTITGTVTDPAGASVPNARVTVTRLATNTVFNTTTTDTGEFSVPSLPVGEYRVTVENAGFTTSVHNKITLTAGATVRLDTKLAVGTNVQSVEVSAESSTLQTDDNKMRNDIPNQLIQGLPTVVSGNMRSPFDLAALTPGVSGDDQDVRIGGGQQAAWGAVLDGGSVAGNRLGSAIWSGVNSPALDAIDQFTVDTNGFKAEYGRAGGGVVSFVSKSGTDRFHGSLFDFIRNNYFDARGFFANSVAVYRQHDFGATAGGPLILPKIYNGKGKTYIFLSYEGFRNRVGATTTATAIPPAEFYKGDFRNLVANTRNPDGSYVPIILYDTSTTTFVPALNQYTRTAFPGNQIPVTRFDPVSKAIADLAQTTLTRYRTDVVPGTWPYWQQNYWRSGSSVNPNNKYSVKLDQDITKKHRVAAYLGWNKKESVPGPDGPPGIPGVLNGFQIDVIQSLVTRLSWDFTLTPRAHNRLSFSDTNFKEPIDPIAWNGGWKEKGICIPNVPKCDANLPMIGTGEFGTWGGFGHNGWASPTWSISDDISWSKGKHVIKAGYQYEMTNYNAVGEQNVSGQAGFSAGYTQLPSNTNFTGMAFASFLLGNVSSSTVTTPRYFYLMYNYHAMFVQDDWRITPKVTLNLGLRYEFDTPTTIQGNKCSDFDPTTPNPGASGRLGALKFCGNGPASTYLNRSGPPGWYKGFGPRLGFSYSPNGKMVIRGGAGISYAPVKVTSGSSHFDGFAFLGTPPGGADQSGGVTPAFKLSEGMPKYPIPPFIDPTFSNNTSTYWWQGQDAMRLPEMLSWNLSVQREIARGFMVDVAYSAMMGTHLFSNELDYNRININTLPASLNIFTNAGRNLLGTLFNSRTVNLAANGFNVPYPEFPVTSSLGQALRPFPQYTGINTGIGGDRSGHSTYHSMVVKVTRRFARGLVIDSSYVISKMLTDSDNAGNTNPTAMDMFNRRLDKSLAASDRTHEVKVNWVYELPIGPGKHWLSHGLLSQVIGGWRLGATQRYSSGTPLGFSGAFGFPGNTINNRPYITTYDDWRLPTAGDKFDPNVERYFRLPTLANWNADTPTITQQGWFPLQYRDRTGNMTRNNPKMRNFPQYNENVSLAKTFSLGGENRRELDLRFEGFNVMNRVRFGTPNTNLGSTSFGQVTSQGNAPRTLQLALKVMW